MSERRAVYANWSRETMELTFLSLPLKCRASAINYAQSAAAGGPVLSTARWERAKIFARAGHVRPRCCGAHWYSWPVAPALSLSPAQPPSAGAPCKLQILSVVALPNDQLELSALRRCDTQLRKLAIPTVTSVDGIAAPMCDRRLWLSTHVKTFLGMSNRI